nr:hypothetical protein [Tanacetum cinerariifolium]
MSDSKDSTVTYTEVSSPFEGLSDIGSPRFVVHGYDGLPWMPEDPYVEAALQDPPSPNYVPGPEHPPTPEFVSEPVYPEFMPPEDDTFPAEEQPLPTTIPSPPLPVSPPLLVSSPPLPASPTYPLGYRAAMIRLRVETPSTSYPLPSSTPPSGTPPLL